MGEPTVGILLPEATVRRALRGRPAYERVALYVRAARELGLTPVLLTPAGCRGDLRRVRGYVPSRGRWRPWRGPLPGVVHNRLLPRTRAQRLLLRRLMARLGPRLFNPPVSRDKWAVWRWLWGDPRLRPHLPATWRLTAAVRRRAPALARRYGGLVLKPRRGSVGLGVYCVEARGRGFRCIPPAGRPRRLTAAGLRRLLGRLAARRRYLLQAAVPLARLRGRRFDVRVPVQRDGTGAWTVPGAAVKRARRHSFLTNLGRGGEAHRLLPALQAAFGREEAPRVAERLYHLALAVAERLARRHPHLADLGLDVGLDRRGWPWLIEVNVRDQRWSLRAAGELEAFYALYRNPLAYARRWLAGPAGASRP